MEVMEVIDMETMEEECATDAIEKSAYGEEDSIEWLKSVWQFIPEKKRPFFESIGQIHLDKDEIMRYREMNTL